MKVYDFQPTFNKTTLKNGVRIVTEHHPNTRASCAAIYVNTGTRDEPKSIVGAAHFLEHMVFKGTKNRSAYQIVKELEAVGGEINAYTTKEYTCYHTSSLREDLGISIDVLADLIKNATFEKEDFEVEKQVVLQEIEMSLDQYEEYIFDLFYEKYFSSHSLSQSILGTNESIQGMTIKKINQFYKSHYQGKNLIVSVAGDVDHNEVVKLVSKTLGRSKLKSSVKRHSKPKMSRINEVIQSSSEQTHILMGLPSASFKDKYRFEAYMVNAILGGGMTSKLYQSVREKKGLVYSVYSYLQSFKDCGLLLFYAATTPDLVKKVVKAMEAELLKVIKNGVSKKDLDFFKNQVRGQILLGADDIESRLNSIAINEMIFSEYRPVEKVLDEINEVSHESMREYIDKYFDMNKLSYMYLGNF